MSGEAILRVHDQTCRVRPGDFGVIKVGTVHAWRAAGTTPVRWLQMAAPQPKPPGRERDTFFVRNDSVPQDAAPLDLARLNGALLGHFDEGQIPPGDEGRMMGGGLKGVFLKWLIDEQFGAAHHRLLFIEYLPGVAIGLHDHTYEEAYFILSGEVEATMDGEAVRRQGGRRPLDRRRLRARLRQQRAGAGPLARDVFASAAVRERVPVHGRVGATRERPGGVRIMTAPRTRPFTGAEYLESIRDGREIWIYGERVKDVTTHPAFRNTVRMIARLYDALHDPARKDTLTVPTDTGSGGYTHRFYRATRTADELVGARDAIAEWARISYGWIGRSPDYKAAFLATLGANADYYAPYEDNARRLVQEGSGRSVVRQPRDRESAVDRDRPLDEVKDVYMHVEEETDGGLIVSGAKVVATTSTLTHYNFIANNGALPIKTKPFAFVCIVPNDAPGREAVLPPFVRDDAPP